MLFKIGVIYMYWFFLERVIEGGGSNNLTKVSMDVLKKHVGVFDINVAAKLLSFGVDVVNVF